MRNSMNHRWAFPCRKRLLVLSCLLAMLGGGCTSTPPPIPLSPSSTPSAAASILQWGYEVIEKRYLEPVRISELALNGLRGLRILAPRLSFSLEEGELVIKYGETETARFATPAGEDAAAWAQLTVEAARSAWRITASRHPLADELLIRVMFEAGLARLDRFSHYANATTARESRAARHGSGDIGLRFRPLFSGLEVTAVAPHSPAGEARITAGDLVTRIDGVKVTEIDLNALGNRLRGPVGSLVRLSLHRQKAAPEISVTLPRVLILPETVFLILDGEVAVIRIQGFNQHTATSVAEALQRVHAAPGSRVRGILLDLRNNQGGLLDQAIAISEMFLSSGTVIVVRIGMAAPRADDGGGGEKHFTDGNGLAQTSTITRSNTHT
ncbi:MAG: S41 family peptidase, partial [Alphaproteobacteria bacterium]